MSRSCYSTFDVEAFAWRRFVWTLGILPLLAVPRPGTAQIMGDSWYPIGPAPIFGFFTGGTVGRATAIAANPFNADEFWIGGAAGGVWHTGNAGRTWQAIMNRTPSLAVGSLQVTECSATGCGKIYVGSGENAIRRDTYHGRGIYIGTPAEFSNWNWRYSIRGVDFDFTYGSVVDLALVPGPPGPTTTLLAAVSSGTTVSASEATVTAPAPPSGFGIYISEDDAVTWRRLRDDLPTSALPSNLDLVPSSATGDTDRIYASFSAEGAGLEQGGIYRSDNLGVSWRKLDNGFPSAERQALRGRDFDHVELAVSPNDVDVLYVSVGYCRDRLGRCSNSVDVYRSLDGGDSWEFRGAPSTRSYSRYTHALAVAPGDDERIFWGGVPLMRSDDGGETFVFSDTINICPIGAMDANCVPTNEGIAQVHSDMREIVFHPADPNRALLTGDGGLAISFDGGIRWVPRNDGLSIVGFHTVAASPHFGALLAGSQDNGMQVWNGEPRWRQAGSWGEDGSASIIDVVEGTPPGNQGVYGGGNSGVLWYSDDAANGWARLSSGYADTDGGGARIMYAPAFQDPDPPFDIYTGGNRVYRRPRGTSAIPWTAVSPILATGTSTEIRTSPTEFTNSITALALARGSTRVFAGFYLGQVFVSDNPDIGGSWRPTGVGTLPNAPVTWMAVDPDDPDTAYATFSGFGSEPKVWKTDNGGGSWTSISSGLPTGVPVNTVAVEEAAARNILWIGLDSHPQPSPLDPALASVFKSVDGGITWLPWSRGLPNVPVFDLEVDTANGRVIAATHGRGAYLLGSPQLNNYEGWVDGDIWDVPIFGSNFPANQSCTVTLRQADGSECASGSIDAQLGTIRTNASGTLVSSRSDGGIFWYQDRPVAWACYNGRCLGGISIGACNDDADLDGDRDPLTSVEVDCTGPLATSEILGCPPLSNPPSAVFNIDGLPDLSGSGGGSGGPTGIVLLSASLEGRGETTSLCTVAVPLEEEDVDPGVDFLGRAQQAFASSPTCLAAGVEAEVTGSAASGTPLPPGADEDQFTPPRRLNLRAPGLTGGMLVPAVAVPAGDLAQSCVSLNNLNVPLLGQLKIMTSAFPTGTTGAAGGHLRFTQMTSLGPCSISLPTTPGQTEGELAQALVDALQTPGIPGPHPQCPSQRNMRDVARLGDAVVTISADHLQICTDDEGIGLQLRPEGLRHTHPVAVARVDRSGSTVTLDGTGSMDADSSPGSRDDIVRYRWFALDDAGLARPLGEGDRLHLSAPLPRRVRLQVADRHGLSDLAEVDVTAGALSPLPFGAPKGNVFSLHVGGTIPVASFADTADTGWSLGLDLERAIGRRTSALLFLRHQRFDVPRRSDLTATSLAASVRHYLGSGPWFGFVQGGAGYYDLNRGDGTVGLHAGGGVHLPLPSSSRALEFSLDGHWLEDEDRFFLAPEVAFKWRF